MLRGLCALLVFLGFATLVDAAIPEYTVTLVQRDATPLLSSANAIGRGHSVCNATFNPAWVAPSPGAPHGALLIRLNYCPPEMTDGGLNEHISLVRCKDVGCTAVDDVGLDAPSLFGPKAEDPRVLFNPADGYFYNWYYAGGDDTGSFRGRDLPCVGSQCTVVVTRSRAPALPGNVWEPLALLNWHRNGCCMLMPAPGPHYCLFGEGPDPTQLPGVGIASTFDFITYQQESWSGLASGAWLLPEGSDEIKLEAGTHPVRLSSGDWLHFYAAATPGWVEHGNYTAGYLVLSGADPRIVLQRSDHHLLIPQYPFETLCNGTGVLPPDSGGGAQPGGCGTPLNGGYQGERANAIFLCSAAPTDKPDVFRLFFGAGDGSVGSATVAVTMKQ